MVSVIIPTGSGTDIAPLTESNGELQMKLAPDWPETYETCGSGHQSAWFSESQRKRL